MTKLEELKEEATQAGITFNAKIGEAKLQEKLDAFYAESEADADIVEKVEVEVVKPVKKVDSHAAIIKALEQENRKTRIVKITMVDKREASTATDAYLSVGSVSMRVPLDVFVEIPMILIDKAKKDKALIHKRVEDGRYSVPSFSPKYVIDYKD